MERILVAFAVYASTGLAFVLLALGAQDAAVNQAEKEYRALVERIAKVQSWSGVMTVRDRTGVLTMKYAVQKPGRIRFEIGKRVIVSDGKTYHDNSTGRDQQGPGPDPMHCADEYIVGFGFLTDDCQALGVTDSLFEGRKRRAIQLKPLTRQRSPMTVYVDSKTGLPVGAQATGPDQNTLTLTFSNLKVNPRLPEKLFQWTPPPSTYFIIPVSGPLVPTGDGQFALPGPSREDLLNVLLPVGSQAPDFSLPSVQGGTVSLKEQLRGAKALIVSFWSYG